MARVKQTGFETGDDAYFDVNPGSGSGAIETSEVRGSWSTYSFKMNGNVSRKTSLPSLTEFYMRFPIKMSTGVGTQRLLMFEGNIASEASLKYNSTTNKLEAYRGDLGTLLEAASATTSTNVWHLVEIYYKLADSGGRFQ